MTRHLSGCGAVSLAASCFLLVLGPEQQPGTRPDFADLAAKKLKIPGEAERRVLELALHLLQLQHCWKQPPPSWWPSILMPAAIRLLSSRA